MFEELFFSEKELFEIFYTFMRAHRFPTKKEYKSLDFGFNPLYVNLDDIIGFLFEKLDYVLGEEKTDALINKIDDWTSNLNISFPPKEREFEIDVINPVARRIFLPQWYERFETVSGKKTHVLKLDKLFNELESRMQKAYRNPELYSSPDMFSPPAERRPHVLRLELTTGCKHNSCTFCSGYKGIPFKERSFEQFKQHYQEVRKALGGYAGLVTRLFIGGGNALSAKQETLERVLDMLRYEHNPKRISLYGRADSMLKKGEKGLTKLREKGLKMIYWGVETGSDNLLKYVNKDVSAEENLRAGRIANKSNIYLSVMVMPGLGGIKYFREHAEQTAELLDKINPEYITLLCVNPDSNSEYARRMKEEEKAGTNRPLTNPELVEQIELMVRKLNADSFGRIGMFDESIDQVGKNPLSFPNTSIREKQSIIMKCQNYLVRHGKLRGIGWHWRSKDGLSLLPGNDHESLTDVCLVRSPDMFYPEMFGLHLSEDFHADLASQ